MFSIVVAAVAVGVFTMYIRHELQLRRKRLAETERSPEHRAKPEAPDQRSEGSEDSR